MRRAAIPWHDERNVVEKAIGEHLDGTPLENPDNHRHMVALFFFYYNFCRTHSTLRVTPAMEAGLTNYVWSIDEMYALFPEQHSATQRIDRGLIMKALGEKVS